MAKDRTQQFKISVSGAIQSVANLGRAVDNNREKVKSHSLALKAANKQAEKNAEQLGLLAKALNKTVKTLDAINNRTEAATRVAKKQESVLNQTRGSWDIFGNSVEKVTNDLASYTNVANKANKATTPIGAQVLSSYDVYAQKIERVTEALINQQSGTGKGPVAGGGGLGGIFGNSVEKVTNDLASYTNAINKANASTTPVSAQVLNSYDIYAQKIEKVTAALIGQQSGAGGGPVGGGGGLGGIFGNPAGPANQLPSGINKGVSTPAVSQVTLSSYNAYTGVVTKATAATTAQQRAANKLANQIAQATKGTSEFGKVMFSASRIALGFTIHRIFFAILNSIEGSVEKAKEFQKAITEIQTISLSNAQTTEQWKDELLGLSTAFGVDVLDLTKGTYQALSNQVIEAGESTAFMTEEIKLSLTTVASLAQAVDATSSVIKAYGLSSRDAGNINAVLFKTVELGRIRLDELGSGFGRLNVISNQLGISFLEQNSAISTLTVKGIEADTAMTLLQNVMLHLIKPSKEMDKVLQSFGVNSGKAAIETFGFFGTLRKLAEAAKNSHDETAELAALFEDLRAIVGAQGLVQSFDDLESNLVSLKGATKDYGEAVKITLDGLSTRANVQLAKMNAEFLKIGESLLNFAVKSAESFGGADKALQFLIRTVRIGAELYISYAIATRTVSTVTAVFSTILRQTTVKFGFYRTAVQLAQLQLRSFQAAEAAASLGISVGIAILAEAVIRWQNYEQSLKDAAQAAGSAADEINSVNLTAFNDKVDKAFGGLSEQFDANSKSAFQWLADLQATNNALAENFDKTFKQIGKNIDAVTEKSIDRLDKALDKTKKEAEKLRSLAEKLDASITDRSLSEETRRFDVSLEGKNDFTKLSLIQARKEELIKRAEAARLADEQELNNKLLDEAEKLADEQIKIAQEAERKALEAKEKVVTDRKIVRVRDPITRRFRLETRETEKTVLAPDEKAAARAAADILEFERERQELALTRIEAETELLKKTEEAAIAEESLVRLKESKLAKFKDTLAAVDAFDNKTGTVKEFKDLVGDADAAGIDAGITGAERLAFLREANAKIITLKKQAALDETNAVLEIERKALEQATKNQAEAVQKQKDAAKKAVEEEAAFVKDTTEKLAALKAANFNNLLDIVGAGDLPGGRREVLLDKPIQELENLLRLSQENIKKGVNDPALLSKIEKLLIELTSKQDSKLLKGASPFKRIGPNGEEVAVSFQQSIGTIVDALQKLKETQTKAKESDTFLKDMNEQLEEARVILDQIPPQFRQMGETSAAAAAKAMTGTQALNEVYEGMIERLQKIIELQKELQGVTVGPENFNGFKGPGIPGIPGLEPLTRRPTFNSVNRGTSVASTVSIGDIYISPARGTSDAQVMEIASKLVRLSRRGLFSV